MPEPTLFIETTKTVWGIIKAVFTLFHPVDLRVVRVEQRQWIGGVLTTSYTFKADKARFSRTANKNPIQIDIPSELDMADLRLHIPEAKIAPVNIPATALSISAHDLIGDYLDKVRDGQEFEVDLRIRCPQQDVIDIVDDKKEGCKIIIIRNPHAFPVKSCGVERQLASNELVDEIRIVKGNEVVSSYKLFKLQKISTLEFQGQELRMFFPNGISVSEDDWLSNDRTENRNGILKFTIDLDPEDEIEIRFIYRTD